MIQRKKDSQSLPLQKSLLAILMIIALHLPSLSAASIVVHINPSDIVEHDTREEALRAISLRELRQENPDVYGRSGVISSFLEEEMPDISSLATSPLFKQEVASYLHYVYSRRVEDSEGEVSTKWITSKGLKALVDAYLSAPGLESHYSMLYGYATEIRRREREEVEDDSQENFYKIATSLKFTPVSSSWQEDVFFLP